MTLRREPDRASGIPVERVGFDVARPVAEMIAHCAHIGEDEAVLQEQVGFKALAERELGASFFVARVGGELAGMCELYVGGGVAQIEDVNTLEEYRGRGVARARAGGGRCRARRGRRPRVPRRRRRGLAEDPVRTAGVRRRRTGMGVRPDASLGMPLRGDGYVHSRASVGCGRLRSDLEVGA
jgi:hypothetical protein